MPTFVEEARQAGFSDDEIARDPMWAEAKQAGFSDDEVASFLTGLKNPKAIPPAFIDRFMGYDTTKQGGGAGFLEGAKVGWGDKPFLGPPAEDRQKLIDAGWWNRPGGPYSPLRFANEAIVENTYKAVELLFRGVNAGIMGTGAMLGQVASENLGGDETDQKRARREVAQFVNIAALLAGAHSPVVRAPPELSATQSVMARAAPAVDEVIGHLPRADDFTNAAKIVGDGEVLPHVRENIVRQYEENGLHPSEVAKDALSDPRFAEGLRAERPTENRPDTIKSEPAEPDILPNDLPTLPATAEPQAQTLSEFIRSRGGLAPDPELNAIYGKTKLDMIRKDGMSLDQAREAAVEGGYIQDEGFRGPGLSTSTPSDLLDALSAEEKGQKRYPIGAEPQEVVGLRRERARLESDLTAEIQGLGGDYNKVPKKLRDRSLYLMYSEGKDAIGAYEQALMEADYYAERSGKIKRTPENKLPDEPGTAQGASRGDQAGERAGGTGDAARDAGLDDGAEGRPSSLGAAATDIPVEETPVNRLVTRAQDAGNKLLDVGKDIQQLVAPMATGSDAARAIAKDFANTLRRNRYEWSKIDEAVEKNFTPEQRKRMWDAADEESVARQLGESTEHQGLTTLTKDERAAVEALQSRAQNAWVRARDLGMVEGEGLPSYTPRMLINIAEKSGDGPRSLNGIGGNLKTTTGQMKGRKYTTAEETEAAAKAKFGADAQIARDIRSLPLATAKLEDAIAGRTLIDKIKEYGKSMGDDTVVEGGKPAGSEHKWFTIDHPAFQTWRPKLKYDEAAGKADVVKDAEGNIIFEKVPIYVRDDFEGPLKAVLSHKSGALYDALISLKAKTMSVIMNSPLIHNAVEWGRALPAMPGKVATFKIYFEGYRAKHDMATMREAIDNGLVPIGKRFFNQDITGVMEAPDLTPGRSWTAKILAAVPGLFDEGAGLAVKRAVDKAGDFWHNTLLWDRVADLQMGLYTNFRDDLLAKGVDRQTASRAASHWANRYAGALPQEAMSDGARKIANVLMFSRSFTLGNLGVMKDMLNGLPKDVMAQISRDVGSLDPKAKGYIKSMAVRKAVGVVAADMALMYIGNSILQSTLNVMLGDKSLSDEMKGYADRLNKKLHEVGGNPVEILQPLKLFEDISSTQNNEPGKQDRVLAGYTKDGTAIYARNPAGKIGEEFTGYVTSPLDMIRKKGSTIFRPLWQILSNDKGFGRKVYDPTANAPDKYIKNVALIVQHLMMSQLPEGQIRAASDLVKGEGDTKLNLLQAFGPFTGVTFSRGAPGGPAVGEMYRAREEHQFAVNAALPDIRKQIARGDIGGAAVRMTELGIPKGLQQFYIKTTLHPETRLSARATKDFYLYATPAQRQRFEEALSSRR